MDRKRVALTTELAKLKEECFVTTELLQQLITIISNRVNAFEKLSNEEFSGYSKYFLAVSQFQYLTHQKLLELNVGLEEIILKQVPPDFNYFKKIDTSSTVNELLSPIQDNIIKDGPKNVFPCEELSQLSDISLNIDKPDEDTDICSFNIEHLENCEAFDLSDVGPKQYSLGIVEKLSAMYLPNLKEDCDTLKKIPNVKLKTIKNKMNKGNSKQSKKVEIENKNKIYKNDNRLLVDSDKQQSPIEIRDGDIPKVNDICMIGYLESPSKFYVQLANENSEMLDLLTFQLSEIYKETVPTTYSKEEAMSIIGKFGCYQFKYDWYRVEILDWMLDESGALENNIVIQLIDFGDILEVSYNTIQPIMESFCHLPKMGRKCELISLYPPASTKACKRKTWPKTSKEGFKNICGDINQSIFRITFVSKSPNKNAFAIDIINVEEKDEEKSIGQQLLDLNLAVEILDDHKDFIRNSEITRQILNSQGLSGTTSSMTQEEILDRYFKNMGCNEASNVNEAVMNYDPKDEALTCKNLRNDGTCYKGTFCKFRHTPLTSGFTMDKEPVFVKAFETIPLLRPNDEVILTICHIININTFYAQLRDTSDSYSFKPTINTLIKEMNDGKVVKKYKPFNQPPCCGMIVTAKHWNGSWYRAQVLDVAQLEDNSFDIKIFVVDFGDTFNVPLSSLRKIYHDFLQLPFQAIECRLFNIKHKEGVDTTEERRYFEARYLGQSFKAKIIAAIDHMEVLLFTDSGDDIGLKMIEEGYGECNNEPNFPHEREFLLLD